MLLVLEALCDVYQCLDIVRNPDIAGVLHDETTLQTMLLDERITVLAEHGHSPERSTKSAAR